MAATNELPDTPAGRQAAWVIDQLGGVIRKGEIKARFDPAFLEAVAPFKIRALSLSMKAAKPFGVEKAIGHETALTVRLTSQKGPLLMELAVQPEGEHRILGLRFSSDRPTVQGVLRKAEASTDVAGLIDTHIAPFAEKLKGKSTGAVVAVSVGGEVTIRAFGVPEDAIFEIGSITKPVTATLLAEMVRAGEVALDDEVQRYLPDGVTMPQTDGRPVTLLELATHTSGLPRLPVNMNVTDESDPYKDVTVDLLFEGLNSTTLSGRGTVAYSNLGFAVLGNVLARAAGRPFFDLLTERVLTPLGMKDAGERGLGDNPRRVRGHERGKPVPYWSAAAVAPAGGIEGTVSDVLAFSTAHANAEADDALTMTHERRSERTEVTHTGLAWVIVETDHGDVFWHNGMTGGFSSFTGFHPGTGVAIAVLVNVTGESPDAHGAAILGSLVAARTST